jgi:N-acetylglucosamine-6-phosphate deacetylase
VPADDALVIAGGTVLAPARSVIADVSIAGGRIVSGVADVGTSNRPGGPGGRSEHGTVGAGAERSVVGTSAGDHVPPAAGVRTPAAGGAQAPAGAAGAPGAATIDAAGLLVAPGLVDLQCNGAGGIDLSAEPGRLWEVAALLPRWGVTAWLPTIVTGPAEVRARALAALRAGPPPGIDGARCATPLGLHLEGPFLSPERRGAHRAEHLALPDPALVEAEGWSAAGGVALVTLAPELPGALDVVAALAARGTVVSAGHSSATTAQATAGVDAGISYVTHLFNAMAPLHHREPGLAGVALTDRRVRVGIIADGVHLHPTTVALAAAMLGDRLSLVTDAVSALGGPGDVGAGSGVRLAGGTLAGSTVPLDRAVRNLAAWAGLSLPAALSAASATAADVVGLADRGRVAPGDVGDVVLLDQEGRVVVTVVRGTVAFDRRTLRPHPRYR